MPNPDYDRRLSIQGSGQAVVLVPGLDGTGELFYRQVPLLARSYRTATYALRDDASTMDTLVADLGDVIDTVAPDRRQAIVVGESFGGTLAMSFALSRPEQVLALVILNSFAYFAPRFRLRLARYGLGMLPWGAMALVRRATGSRLHSRHTGPSDIERFMTLMAATHRAGYINRLKVLTTYDLRDRLHEIRPPTLFLAADQDRLVPSVVQGELMAARVPDATLRVLEGHGHICLIAPDIDLARILAEWQQSRGDSR